MQRPLRITLRDLFWLILLVCVIAAWCADHAAMAIKGPALRMHFQTRLHQDAIREIALTEHTAGGFFSMPVWQVWELRSGEEDWEPLFTVVPGFQEREPGMPEMSSDGSSIADERQSYAFDLDRRVFSVNNHPSDVYRGPFGYARPGK
jgi:hypothetical protein